MFASTRLSRCMCALLLMTCAVAQAQRPLNSELVRAKWQAQWIAAAGSPEKDAAVFYFRKTIELDRVPAHFWVHVSGDNRFLLHVNGVYAAEGPARGDAFHWRFETVDLAPSLKPGSNLVAATVWNFGARSPIAQMSVRSGFLLQGDSPAESALNSDASWQVKQEKGRGTNDRADFKGYYGAGPGEHVDGRIADAAWDSPASTAGWSAAKTIGHGATREAQDADNGWQLVQDALPPMEHRRQDAGVAVRAEGLGELPHFPGAPLEVPAQSHVVMLLDRRTLTTAYPELTVSGGRDAEIELTYSEALYDAQGDKADRNQIEGRHIEGLSDAFISGGGSKQVFQPLWWRTWRYLQVTITTHGSPLRVEDLSAWFTAYPFVERAKISGEIPELDALWQTGWRTARLCAHETYMDAPYWEQLQYVGDTRIQALVSYAMTGDSRLSRQAIENIDASRITDGLTQSRFPSSLPQIIPPFSLLWVGMLHDYWMYVDDVALVRETLPHTRGVLDWYAAHLRGDGLLGKVGWWEFGDWTGGYKDGVPPQDADGGSAFLTLQFIEALRNAAELERQYGSAERATQYEAVVRRAAAALNAHNWDAKAGLYADTPARRSYSQQANVLAVWLDVAPREQQKAILRRVMASKWESPTSVDGQAVPRVSQMSYYFRFYLSRALEHAGMEDAYLEQLGPWYGMLKLGLSTWAENPEPTRSDCHAWSASPNYDLLTVVAGIHAAAPGFARVRIAPHLAKLTHLEAAMPHGEGEIRVRYERVHGQWQAEIALPEGLSGEFVWAGKSYALHPGAQKLTF